MKGHSNWSYAPYRPLIEEKFDIYISRVVPDKDSIHIEWIGESDEYSVYIRIRDNGEFVLAGKTDICMFDINNLISDSEYEFYVEGTDGRSVVRLARCGECVGTVVNYLHPDDEVYGFSGHYLCSPSLLVHPDGYMLASMDLYAHAHPQNLTLIFRSDDNGKSWHYLTELMPCFWGKLFVHRGDVYMLACSTEYGDLLIGKSTDGGRTFGAPVCLLRGGNGKNGSDGIHKNPQNIVYHKGRIYTSLEWGNWQNKSFCHAAMVMSCDENDDLMVPENWSFTEPLPFGIFADELEGMADDTMTIEGTLAVTPSGRLENIMRFGKRGYAIRYKVDDVCHESKLEYAGLMEFGANLSKFMIKYDTVSGKYYSVATRLYEGCKDSARNLLSLMCSSDLEHWETVCDIYDYRDDDVEKIGFQYVDFEFDGDDIIFLCRTAFNDAHNFHDANYSVFDRIKDFRNI